MDTKFTPGPWLAVFEKGNIEPAIMAGEYYVATAHIGMPVGRQDANARLIAAAPDLLDALETMQRDGNDFAEWHPNFHKAIAKARAAIAKATGKEV